MLKAVSKSPPSSARARFCAKSRPSETVQRDSADKLNTVSKSRRNGRNMRNKLVLLDSEHLRNTVTKSPHSCAGACFPLNHDDLSQSNAIQKTRQHCFRIASHWSKSALFVKSGRTAPVSCHFEGLLITLGESRCSSAKVRFLLI